MSESAPRYDVAAVRRLLLAAFTPEELYRFCQDRPVLSPIVVKFGPGQGLDDMTAEVITYCQLYELWPVLLREVETLNPRQYGRFGPYTLPEDAPDPPGPAPDSPPPGKRGLFIGELSAPGGCAIRNVALVMALVLSISAAAIVLGPGLVTDVWPHPEPTEAPIKPTRPSPEPTEEHAPTEPADYRTPTNATPSPTPTPPRPPSGVSTGWQWLRPIDNMVMVYVPAGEFLRGSTTQEVKAILDACRPGACDPAGSYQAELHQRSIYLDGFWIDQTEVTVAQYQRCVEAGACKPAKCPFNDNLNIPTIKPVVCVTWNDARAYAAWAGGRLPSEAEWEKAARGTGGQTYPWGDDFECRKGNFDDTMEDGDEPLLPGGKGCDGFVYTAEVGMFGSGASPYGALNMLGNAWEWVEDRYDPAYYDVSPDKNPPGPGTGTYRVQRGGSYKTALANLRCAFRGWYPPGEYRDDLGFRIVFPDQ